MKEPFRNEPLTDFSRDEAKKAMAAALGRVKAQFGKQYDLILGGEHVRAEETFPSVNPSQPNEVVGHFPRASEQTARRAIEVAAQAFETWQYTPAEERSRLVLEAARLMRERKHELAAWEIYEEGKSWLEADADVAEAIDFCEFYARENLRLAAEQPLTHIPSEKNELRYLPLGVAAIIPPWNFPLAILVGMTSAAIVTGNTVVLKPASYSPTIGYKFAEIMEEVGLPPGVLNFLTGSGSVAGDAIVVHPKTRIIAFTGSMDVGLQINEKAAHRQPGQIWIKRVIAEMGGKNAVIVDKDADFDAALEGVTASAFGYQGQKCSACSRLIVDESLYDRFVERAVEKARAISVGPTEDPSHYMGPVINREAMDSILGYIEKGKAEGATLLTGGGAVPDAEGYFIQPTVFGGVDPRAVIAQEEIFGPVLAAIRAESYEHALSIANDTQYGLTGSVYTTSREKIEEAKRRFHVGNLYFNRKCTGALVGVHPFGGFNMSGTDSKAGGRDYLLLFTQAKAISEKVE